MEAERTTNWNQQKEDFKGILDDFLERIEEEEERLKELQVKFGKQKKEIRKWLSWMG